MDDCQGCQALRAEAGTNAEFYAGRLPVRGWAGHLSDSERAYLRAHPPEWYRLALARGGAFSAKSTESDAPGTENDAEDIDIQEAA